MVIEDWGIVGSSNLNHRSLFHDLEADIVVSGVDNVRSLAAQFEIDCASSKEVTLGNWRDRPWIERVLGKGLLMMRRVL